MTLLQTMTSGGISRYFLVITLSLILFIAFFFSIPNSSFSETAESAEKLFQFAESLFKEGEYYRAITEYKRFISYYPENSLAETVMYQIGNCYFLAEKWDEAIKSFKEFTEKYPDSSFAKDALLKTGESYLKKGDKENSKKIFELINEKFKEDEVGNMAKIKLGMIYLEDEKWNNASDVFGSVEENSKYKGVAEKLSLESGKGSKLPQKSPVVAGVLSSILPGAGQLYTGKKLDSLVAFLLNGIFIWGAVESFNKDLYVAGGVLSFFELGWYSGNIYNAISDAHKYNRDIKKRFIEELKFNSKFTQDFSFRNKPILFSYKIEF